MGDFSNVSICDAKHVKAFGILHNQFESGSTLTLLNVSLTTPTSIGSGGYRKTVAPPRPYPDTLDSPTIHTRQLAFWEKNWIRGQTHAARGGA